ncbi:glyoxalase [Actinomadura sp. NBRC 104412]|uniref:VOC family protein n=1 Tax=Actinomadura sp. NBRC 104412 TaxID=3032203 RepID=UPI0024A0C98F|nr:VOC family protein [Actinomadura sp. NBRC 104412]GLZ05065.1 glyoxalase [Actinomadura sp. NBRC 104412]
MTDPLEALRMPITPVDPDPDFAARLRERIRQELLQPSGGTTMTTSTETTPDTVPGTVSPLEAHVRSLTPYICVDDGRRAIDWYMRVLGARQHAEPVVMEDGRVGHAELAIGDSVLMLADEWPELGLLGPKARGGPSQSIYLRVPDVDAVVARAVREGAELARPVADYPHGRNGVINDPFGHRWMVTSPPGVPSRPRHGDVSYASLRLPDADRAAAFYGSVLDWRIVPGGIPESRRVEGLPTQDLGIWGGQEHPTMFLCFAVDDVHQAVRRVREAGGEAEEPSEEPYGTISMCTDDQGLAFAVCEDTTSAGTAGPSRPADPAAGEVTYLTMEVPDSARARAFFGAVLGWDFVPGRVPDGWSVRSRGGGEVYPMTGMHGGHDTSTVVPVYAVQDIDAAVARVRAAGGTASDPESHPYGTLAECTDDQGTRFYLGDV